MTDEKVIVEAYRLIRRKARNIMNPANDETLGAYVRGVVDLQTELWDEMRKEQKIQNYEGMPSGVVNQNGTIVLD